MRKLDKIKNIKKANILLEQRSLSQLWSDNNRSTLKMVKHWWDALENDFRSITKNNLSTQITTNYVDPRKLYDQQNNEGQKEINQMYLEIVGGSIVNELR